MKTKQTLLAVSIFSASLLTATGAHAALESRLGGLAVYDTDLNITWLANAGAFSPDGWYLANAWATGLVVEGISGWRLPVTLPADPSCSAPYSTGGLCTGSEMGHLFYYEMGGISSTASTSYNNLFYNI